MQSGVVRSLRNHRHLRVWSALITEEIVGLLDAGALGPMVPVVAGDIVHAQIGALGTVSCRMV